MKKLLTFGAMALLVTAFALPVMAEQPATPAEPIKMALTDKPVIFEHSIHKDLKCGECHHQVDGKDNYQKCSDAGCHDKIDKKDKSVNSYYQAIHKAKPKNHASCISCHNTVVKADPSKKKAMTSCIGSSCHAK